MTKEEAKKFGLRLLHGIMERNKSYPAYANDVKQAIDALSESSSSEIPKDLEEAAEEFAKDAYPDKHNLIWMFKRGAKWQAEHSPLPEDTVLFNKGVEEGKRLAEEDILALIESRISEIVGDAQPKPILRAELQELIKRIKDE